MGMMFHSSTRALVNWGRVAEGGWRCRTCPSKWSHGCSIGDKSGLYGGLSSGCTLLFATKTWQILATWGLALSCCCHIAPICPRLSIYVLCSLILIYTVHKKLLVSSTEEKQLKTQRINYLHSLCSILLFLLIHYNTTTPFDGGLGK